MVFEVCAVIATVVFIVLVFFIIWTLITLQKSLIHFKEISAKLETKVDPIGIETIRLLKKTNEMAETIEEELEAINPLFNSISNLGSALQDATESLNNSYYVKPDEKKKQWREKLEELIELTAAGIKLWQQIKKRR